MTVHLHLQLRKVLLCIIPMLTCSRCSKKPRIDGQCWCRSCLTEYQRENRNARTVRKVKQARISGAEAFREYAATKFERDGSVEFSGFAVAELVRQLRLPD